MKQKIQIKLDLEALKILKTKSKEMKISEEDYLSKMAKSIIKDFEKKPKKELVK